MVEGHLNNDAYHLSAPSPSGEGTFGVIGQTLRNRDKESLAMVNVHGTATMFNDQMESKAIERAGLSHVPLTALKGCYGHTLGASGVLETILSMVALEDGCILPVKGFEEIGVSGKITISNTEGRTDKQTFLKIISGFGGCNGAVLYTRNAEPEPVKAQKGSPYVSHSVRITSDSLTVDGKPWPVSSTGRALLTEIYKEHIGDYPKFHKMDMFTRLVFVASELLIQQEEEKASDDRAIILYNSSSSVVADRKHIATTFSDEGFFPSPSVFLYTLPNIVTGEIAIKHGYKGETSLYILDSRNDGLMEQITSSSFSQSETASILTGWVDCSDEDTFEAELKILTK
jgi:3-oxoacyl-[acyl-carrier-protein] synthase-1